MAKKNPKNAERKALVEKMRQEQARKERRRSMAILGVCILAVVGLLAAALVPYIKDQREKDKIAKTDLSKIGVAASAASCDDVTTKSAQGSGDHKPTGTKIDYPDAPPAYGSHWGNFLQGPEIRNFYTVEDRPELERVVHSLEHGHTLIWYDDTIKAGSKEYKDLQAVAQKYDGKTTYVNIVPWKATDGGKFPEGKHVVLTHWTGPKDQKGVWQYCGKPSGAVIEKFVKDYPSDNAPEPGAV
ncbi:MAG: DUF3105 domain-containing protein [Nocardioidaceae bacterium]|nr:DUF3105 domain-containing protein [Nocardioidaceae bacterium]